MNGSWSTTVRTANSLSNATPRKFILADGRGLCTLGSSLPLTVYFTAGTRLQGVDAHRMDALSARVAVERQQYADAQWSAACGNRDMYTFATPAAREAMEAGDCPLSALSMINNHMLNDR